MIEGASIFLVCQTATLKMIMLSKLIYVFDVMTIIKILLVYFVDLENTIQGFRWNHRRPRQLKQLWEGITKLGHHNMLQNSRQRHPGASTQKTDQWGQCRGLVYTVSNKIQSCGPPIFVKGVLKTCSGKKKRLANISHSLGKSEYLHAEE